MFLADLTDMKLFRFGWPKLGPKLDPLEGRSAIVDNDCELECVDPVGWSGRAEAPDSAAMEDVGVVGVGVADCSEVEADGVDTRAPVVGRRERDWIESAVAGL